MPQVVRLEGGLNAAKTEAFESDLLERLAELDKAQKDLQDRIDGEEAEIIEAELVDEGGPPEITTGE
jgi:hypothetical protein